MNSAIQTSLDEVLHQFGGVLGLAFVDIDTLDDRRLEADFATHATYLDEAHRLGLVKLEVKEGEQQPDNASSHESEEGAGKAETSDHREYAAAQSGG